MAQVQGPREDLEQQGRHEQEVVPAHQDDLDVRPPPESRLQVAGRVAPPKPPPRITIRVFGSDGPALLTARTFPELLAWITASGGPTGTSPAGRLREGDRQGPDRRAGASPSCHQNRTSKRLSLGLASLPPVTHPPSEP